MIGMIEIQAEIIKLGEINNEFIYEYRMNGENVSESECDPYLTYFDGIENPKRPNQGSFVVSSVPIQMYENNKINREKVLNLEYRKQR